MLKIGAFARLAHVSTRMVRHYDRLGLLKPTAVNSATAYRFYSLAQLPRLRQITVLRELDFTLEEIALLVQDEAELDVRRLLEAKRSELRERIARDRVRLQRIEAGLGTFNKEQLMETATEQDALLDLLHTQYDLDITSLELLHSVEHGRMYVAQGANAEPWEVHARPTQSLADTIYTTWLGGYRGHSMTDFLLSRASVLMHLQAQRFPTQQLIPSNDGEPLGA